MARLPYPNVRSQHSPPKHHTLNVLKLLSYSSATVEHWANMGNAHLNSSALSKRDRELVILLSTAKFKSSYEWTHHIPISRRAGVTDAQRSELEEAGKQEKYFQDGRFNASAGFSDKDLSFVEATIEQPEVSDGLWADARDVLSDREIVLSEHRPKPFQLVQRSINYERLLYWVAEFQRGILWSKKGNLYRLKDRKT